MRKLGWHQWLLLAMFLLALLVTGLFGVRTVRRAAYWRQHRDEPIRAWMSVGYVAHSYRVPPHVLYKAVGLPQGPPPDRRPLREIAGAQNRPVEVIISELQKAIVHARPPYPPPPPPDGGAPP